MNPLTPVDLQSIHVLDGGLATELERRGCDLSGPLWSAKILDTAPDIIRQIHLDYLRAGADCISTASYQVSRLGYSELGRTGADAVAALQRSVEIANAAREEYRRESARPTFVAVSLGPYGAALHNGAEFHGRYNVSFDGLVRFHSERLAALDGVEADLVALETVPSLEEARAIAQALGQFPDTTAWVSFTCKNEWAVAHGEPLRECAAFLETVPQVIAIGINCTQPRFVSPLIAEILSGEIRPAAAKPIFVYPNSGELWDAQTRSWHGPAGIDNYAQDAAEWYSAGAQAVGGCCRTTPAHIRAVCESFG